MLANRIAWVTGGGRGIGEAIVKVLSREGAQVAVSDLDQESCHTVVHNLANPDQNLAVTNDVSSKDSVMETLEKIKAKFNRPPDIVVNSAGITIDKYLLRMSEESFDKVIDVNLKGTFLINQLSASAMKEADIKGSIVNISSITGKTGNVGQANYTASKAGVIAFTQTAAKELGKFGIRVNCICPGFIETAMTDAIPEHIRQMMLFQIPLGHFGQAEDIAETAAFLASNRAKYINGAAIDVNGGLL